MEDSAVPTILRAGKSHRVSRRRASRRASIAAPSLFLGLLLLLLDAADGLELKLFARERPLVILVVFLLVIRVVFDGARELNGKLGTTGWPWLRLSRLVFVALLLLRRIIDVQDLADAPLDNAEILN